MYNGVLQSTARIQAAEQFRQWHARGKRAWVWSKLTGQQKRLLNLSETSRRYHVRNIRDGGLRFVPLDQIRGSEGRTTDFDADFRPLHAHNRDRWIGIAVARMHELPLPSVELVQLGDSYFVRDGHHRISVARMMGQQDIDAQVKVWDVSGISSPQMAATPRQTGLMERVGRLSGRFVMVWQQLAGRLALGENVSL